MTYVFAAVAIAIGVLGMMAGQKDDSPGLGGLGLLLILAAVFVAVRAYRRGGRRA